MECVTERSWNLKPKTKKPAAGCRVRNYTPHAPISYIYIYIYIYLQCAVCSVQCEGSMCLV